MTTGIVALSVGLASLLAAPGWYPAASDVIAVADGGTIKGRIVGVISYYAAAAEDGTFRLANVPPGRLSARDLA